MPKKDTQFKKGQSGNPHGRPKLSEQDRLLNKMTKKTFNELCQMMMKCDRSELETIIGGGVPYEVELFILHMLSLGEKPDWDKYQKYLDRRIGKVKDEVDVNLPRPTVVKFRSGEALVMGAEEKPEDEE